MPRKKSMRRFDPRSCVSRVMIEAEAVAVAREADDYKLQSLSKLKEILAERRKLWQQTDESLRQLLSVMSKRDRLVIQCLIFRDFYHLLELFLEHARTQPVSGTAGNTTDDEAATPFSEMLFEGLKEQGAA
jgi:hypothetical protein